MVCPAPYTESAMVADVEAVREALRAMEDESFDAAGRRLTAGLPCLEEVPAPATFAAAYRYLGAWTWILRGDEVGAARWFRASLELEPDHAWATDELPPGHPLLAAWDAERTSLDLARVSLSGSRLAGGEGASWWLDGRELPLPEATGGRPHVLQRADRAPVATWLIEGYRFPPETVEATAEAAVTRRPLPERPSAARSGFGLRVPLLGASALSLGTAGLAYGLAWVAHGDFEASATTAEAERLRARTNAWTVVAGGGLVLGCGLGAWGLVVEPAR